MVWFQYYLDTGKRSATCSTKVDDDELLAQGKGQIPCDLDDPTSYDLDLTTGEFIKSE